MADPDPNRLPEAVTAHFADRLHRLHHAMWHGLRNTWEDIAPEKQASIAALGWQPPRPGRQYAARAVKRPHISNGSGEDFLYFHREMMVQFRVMMAHAGATPVVWVEIPQPGDAGNGAPEPWAIPHAATFERRIGALKTDAYFWSRMRWWDLQFKDPTYLATLKLGELGSLLEFSVHNDMHMRWAALPRDPETGDALPTGRPTHDYAVKWDNPRYDALLEFYSSHVNPFFWRLHGWVDDRIDDWFEAHQRLHPGAIEPEQRGDVSWFKTGTWVDVQKPWVWPAAFSGNGHGHGHGHGIDPEERRRRIKSMEDVAAILRPPAPPPAAEVAAEEPPSAFDLAFKLPV